MSFQAIPSYPSSASAGTGGDQEPSFPNVGPANQLQVYPLDATGEYKRETYSMPAAYMFAPANMTKVISGLIFNDDADFYIRDILPAQYTDKLEIVRHQFDYHKIPARRVPPQGTVDYLEVSRSAKKDRLIQRGLGIFFDEQYMQTPEGQEVFMGQLHALKNSTLLTLDYLVMRALLEAENIYHLNTLQPQYTASQTVAEALQKTKERWAMLNKGRMEFERFCDWLKEKMEEHAAYPNALLLPPRSKLLLTHHPSELNYSKTGPLSVVQRELGTAAVDGLWRDNWKIYETKVFHHLKSEHARNPLMRVREFGSLFWLTNFSGNADLENYKSSLHYAIQIPDMNKNGAEVKIDASNVWDRCFRFKSNGQLSDDHDKMIQKAKLSELRKRFPGEIPTREVDMFVGYDPKRDDAQINDGYYVMKYWGELREKDVTQDNIKDFAQTAQRHIMKTLNDEEKIALNNVQEFTDKLYRAPIKGRAQFYWKAVALSGLWKKAENHSLNAIDASIMNGHDTGCIKPPRVGKEGLAIYDTNDTAYPIVFVKKTKDPDFCWFPLVKIEGEWSSDVFSYTTRKSSGSDFETIAIPNDVRDLYDMKAKIEDLVKAKSALADWERITITDQFEPYGYGHPTGLAVLASMYERRDYRGYSESILEQAHNHYRTLQKVYNAWKDIFPDNPLADKDACPQYFIGNNKNAYFNALTAFGLNLYLSNRFPVYAAMTLKSGTASSTSLNPADIPLIKDHTTYGISSTTSSDALYSFVVESLSSFHLSKQHLYLTESWKKLKDVYESTTSDTSKKWEDFINEVLTKGSNKKNASILELILSELDGVSKKKLKSKNGINWSNMLEKALSSSFVLPSDKSEATPSAGLSTHATALTRLCIHPSVFHELAEAPHADGAGIIEHTVYPMYVRNYRYILGIHSSVKHQFRYAAAPLSHGNHINSLTTSSVLSTHFARGIKRAVGASGVTNVSTKRFAPMSSIRSREHKVSHDEDDDYSDSTTRLPELNLENVYSETVFSVKSQHEHPQFRHTLVHRFHDFSNNQVRLERLLCQSWVTQPINRQSLECWWKHDCLLLVSFELWRLRQRWRMGSGFMMEAGNQLGTTFHGFHHFEWGKDASTATLAGRYVFHAGATIHNPNKLCLIEDLFCHSYVSGEDVSFIDTMSKWDQFITNPDNAAMGHGSILVKMVPYNRDIPPSPQDVAGFWNKTIMDQCDKKNGNPPNGLHGDSIYFYNHLLNLDKLNRERASRVRDYQGRSEIVNTVGWRGHHRIYNTLSKTWDLFITDDGPFGHDIYEGVRDDRAGGYIKPQKYNNTYAYRITV